MTPEDLKLLRARYRMSQAEFAQLIGISRAYLSQLEIGLCQPSTQLTKHLELLALTPHE